MILDDFIFAIKTVVYTALALASLTIVGLAMPNFLDSVASFNDDAPAYPHTGFMPECPDCDNSLPPAIEIEKGGAE